MITRISQFLRSESGKAESKVPALIAMCVLLGIAYWGWKYGYLQYQDYLFKDEIIKNLKYDTFKIRYRPTHEDRMNIYMGIARKYKVNFPKNDKTQYLKISDDPASERWFNVEVKYKRIIKHPIGKPQVKWFHHHLKPVK